MDLTKLLSKLESFLIRFELSIFIIFIPSNPCINFFDNKTGVLASEQFRYRDPQCKGLSLISKLCKTPQRLEVLPNLL